MNPTIEELDNSAMLEQQREYQETLTREDECNE